MPELPQRKRPRLPREAYRAGGVFSVTIGTEQRHPWFLRYPQLADHAVETLRRVAEGRSAQLYAWCVMPDHVHCLVEDRDLVDFVKRFKGPLTALARKLDYGRKLWQQSFYDHGLRREESVREVARYIWHNPVRAELVERAADYCWSGSAVWANWTMDIL